jgi:hypothetical protein
LLFSDLENDTGLKQRLVRIATWPQIFRLSMITGEWDDGGGIPCSPTARGNPLTFDSDAITPVVSGTTLSPARLHLPISFASENSAQAPALFFCRLLASGGDFGLALSRAGQLRPDFILNDWND